MEDYLQAAAVPLITTIVYWIINIIKTAVNNSAKFSRFIPLTACALGVICGVVAFYAVPEIMPTHNVVVALVLGGASGLSATGTNQIIKQLSQDGDKPK
ncbi:MAG TPA: phage holin family protein [Clostridia bacterium]|jgi:RsiW-degrading membrane proteinase PrsW (M82 family)|nr:phage holin family protein [Clostridia bacterium]